MKLYRVQNDNKFARHNYGNFVTYCLVVAETEEKAIELAKIKFKKYYDECLSNNGEEDDYYTCDYYNKLQATELFSDLSIECSHFQAEDDLEEKYI